jgi:hypothetical protein
MERGAENDQTTVLWMDAILVSYRCMTHLARTLTGVVTTKLISKSRSAGTGSVEGGGRRCLLPVSADAIHFPF